MTPYSPHSPNLSLPHRHNHILLTPHAGTSSRQHQITCRRKQFFMPPRKNGPS
ncbi:hypothetical protein HMPREF3038_01703 [Akkermansia sp. KLE1797]|nr:hypothetical protein HMPREF3038_01703 [Akkermansia sp. KLE1797]KXU53906.1 hypothetical protein HMPREF3039_01861 [Akkermansia sp. KLE1798]